MLYMLNLSKRTSQLMNEQRFSGNIDTSQGLKKITNVVFLR